jgi:hypothetical protein
LSNQLAIFKIGFGQIIQSENTPMSKFLASYLLPSSVVVVIFSHDLLLLLKYDQVARQSTDISGKESKAAYSKTEFLDRYFILLFNYVN